MERQTLYMWSFNLLIQPVCRLLDLIVPKDAHYWGFAGHHIKSDQFIENARAVFECVKSDPGIEKIVFVRTNQPDFEITGAENIRIVPLQSWRGLYWLLRCKVLFVTHSIAMDYAFRWGERQFSVLKLSLRKRIVVNLWHGISFKAQYALANPAVRAHVDRVKYRRKERAQYAGLVSSSKMDRYAMAAIFHPIHPDQVWVTGLPRNDFLIRPFDLLPAYLQRQVSAVKMLKKGKRLVTYAPTYRQIAAVSDACYYQFSEEEIARLKKVLMKHNAILGFRMHYFRNSGELFNLEKYIDNEWIVNLGHQIVPEVACVIRESNLFITDYSSVHVEALYLGKPVLAFAYDFEQYAKNQDGIIYDLDLVFPGPVTRDVNGLLNAIDNELAGSGQTNTDRYRMAQQIYFEHLDDRNSERVVARVKDMLAPPQT